MFSEMKCEKQLRKFIRKQMNVKHSVYQMTFGDVLYKVYSVICCLQNKRMLLNILHDELKDGQNTCLTGQITRMVNTLNGFVSGINVSISRNEELTNAIVTLRKKNIKLYGDSYLYVHETVAQVWQMLEDACIPEHEHEAWLEFV
jgi:hypothetical protein